MRLFLLLLLFSRANTFLFFPGGASLYGQRPINCAWLPWRYAGCVQEQKDKFRILEIRGKIPARYGGKSCIDGQEKRVTDRTCSKQQFVISSVIKAIGTVTTQKITGSQPTIRPTASKTAASSFSAHGDHDVIPFMAPILPTWFTTAAPMPACKPRFFVDNTTGIKIFGKNCFRQQTSRRTMRSVALDSTEHRDVLFLVDESGSIGRANFELEKEFVKVLAGKFCNDRSIRRDQTRVALATFQTGHLQHFDFDDYTTIEAFQAAVDRVQYRGGTTCLLDALKAAREKMFTDEKGSRLRKNADGEREADGVIILVTDGCFNCHPDEEYAERLKVEQDLLQRLGIFIIAYMINVDGDCEHQFTNLDDGSACFQGTSVPSWAEFRSHTIDVEKNPLCIGRWYVNEVEAGEEPCG